MKNIEKYEEKLRPFGVNFAITTSGNIRSCKEFRCGNCAFHYVLDSDCYVARLKWLMKEYEEPVLSDKEKEFIKNMIADLDIKISHVKKYRYVNGNGDTKIRIIISVIDSINKDYEDDFVDFVVTEDMPFEDMELNKAYTFEELGL